MPIVMPPGRFIKESNFYLETNTQVFTSPVNRAVQRRERPGARWRMTLTLRPMHRDDAAKWITFFLKLRGMSNTFYASDPDWTVNRGPGTGTPLVKGGGQTGNTLTIDGCTPGVSGWLRESDYFSVNGELKRLTEDVNTDGSGEAALVFEPSLRNAPSDNIPVIVTNPACQMILADDSQLSWQSNAKRIYQERTISAFEVFS
jgi:hypothetical protein